MTRHRNQDGAFVPLKEEKMRKKNQQPLEGPRRHSGKDHVQPLSQPDLKVKLDTEVQKTALKNLQRTQGHK